jgi:hypothetical protein
MGSGGSLDLDLAATLAEDTSIDCVIYTVIHMLVVVSIDVQNDASESSTNYKSTYFTSHTTVDKRHDSATTATGFPILDVCGRYSVGANLAQPQRVSRLCGAAVPFKFKCPNCIETLLFVIFRIISVQIKLVISANCSMFLLTKTCKNHNFIQIGQKKYQPNSYLYTRN